MPPVPRHPWSRVPASPRAGSCAAGPQARFGVVPQRDGRGFPARYRAGHATPVRATRGADARQGELAGLPDGDGWLFEPKWDGFRALVFRDGDELYIQSRDLKPLDRYFPELAEPLRANLPGALRARRRGRDRGRRRRSQFESLLLRIHPAASRVKMLAEETPAELRRVGPARARRRGPPRTCRRASAGRGSSRSLAGAEPPIHLTPATRDRALAADWFDRFEGAGLDGVVAKRLDGAYLPGKRAMLKIKHERTADCVVAGFRWHKNGPGHPRRQPAAGPVRRRGRPPPRRVTSARSRGTSGPRSRRSWSRCATNALEGHPWGEWAEWAAAGAADASGQRLPGATSRWNRGKDLSWEPLRAERVVEVAYDHLQGDRFRHGTTFRRWRPDKPPADCRYDQLETTAPVRARPHLRRRLDAGPPLPMPTPPR